ncbi:hypothetical protein ABKN59_003100 [Abortiporus biennis]
MQAVRFLTRCRPRNHILSSHRFLSSIPASSSSATPWFIDPAEAVPKPIERKHQPTPLLSTARDVPIAPLPAEIPATSPIALLHDALRSSPHLEPGTLLVREPIPTTPGPPLPRALPKGKKRRGGTYFGEGLSESLGSPSLWNWVVIAQVKEGTEKRGGIEAVYKAVRKVLLTANPPVLLPPNHKRKVHNGWAMIDAGEFAVHILHCIL